MKAEFLNFRKSYRPFDGTPHRLPARVAVGPVAMETKQESLLTLRTRIVIFVQECLSVSKCR